MSRITLAIALLALVLIAPQVGAASSIYSYGGPPVAIPDGSTDPGHAWASIVVTDDFSITDLDVEINIDHTWVGDLQVALWSPDGTSRTLVDRLGEPETNFGFSSDNFWGTRFDDEAAVSISSATDADAPFTGSWRTDDTVGDLLSGFDGMSTQGTWQLHVWDNAAVDTGQIRSFPLFVDHDDPSQPVPEPRTLALLGLGLIGLVPIARKSLIG